MTIELIKLALLGSVAGSLIGLAIGFHGKSRLGDLVREIRGTIFESVSVMLRRLPPLIRFIAWWIVAIVSTMALILLAWAGLFAVSPRGSGAWQIGIYFLAAALTYKQIDRL